MTVFLVAAGFAFIIIWLSAAASWAVMTLMSGLMVNASGRIPAEVQADGLLAMLVGEAFVALAGIAAGLAFFWSRWRRRLLWTFTALLVAGIALQFGAWRSFLLALW